MAVLLERMRAAAERAGSEKLAVAAYYQGRARLFMQKGNLAAATDAIERGRAHDLGYQRSMTRADFHGVFLAGLRLEAGDLDGAEQITADLADVPGMEIALPGLRFHLASRRGDVIRARALLPDVVAVVQSTGGRDGEFLHDLVSAALVAPLTVDEVAKLIDGLEGPAVEPSYRHLVMGQLTEAQGDWPSALTHYTAAADSGDLPPAARGTAHVGAARVLIAQHRADAARTHALTASELLQRWSGWRVEQLAAVRSRLGLDDAGGHRGQPAAHAARARGGAAHRGRAHQRRAGAAAVHLPAYRSGACLEHPAQARSNVAHRRGGCPGSTVRRASHRPNTLCVTVHGDPSAYPACMGWSARSTR